MPLGTAPDDDGYLTGEKRGTLSLRAIQLETFHTRPALVQARPKPNFSAGVMSCRAARISLLLAVALQSSTLEVNGSGVIADRAPRSNLARIWYLSP